MALLARGLQCNDDNVGRGRAGGAMKGNNNWRAHHCRLESCGSLSLDLLVVPVQSSSAVIGFDDNTMSYNAMTVGPVNDKAHNRWESWIVWGVIGPEAVEANATNRQTSAGEIDKARDAREMDEDNTKQSGGETREMGQRTWGEGIGLQTTQWEAGVDNVGQSDGDDQSTQ
jgi:hypothetical protein